VPEDFEHPSRSMLQSPHYGAGLPSQHRDSVQTPRCRDATREALSPFASPPLPSLPRALHREEAFVTRDACRLQDTGQNGQGYSGESCWQPPLPFHFRYTTGHHVFQATEPVSVFFTKSVSRRVKRVQQEGLKEVLLLLNAAVGTEVAQLPSGRRQKWCSSLQTEALARNWDPHIPVPALANALTVGSKQKVSAGETTPPNPRNPIGQQFYHSLHLSSQINEKNDLPEPES